MDSITKVSSEAASATAPNLVVNMMAMICGLAVVAFICVATSGLDMSLGFF